MRHPDLRTARPVRRAGSCRVCLLALLCALAACEATDRGRPLLLPVEDAEFSVDRQGLIRLIASAPPGESLSYDVYLDPPPPTVTEGRAGRPRIVAMPDGAVFTWTPGVADARGSRRVDYTLTFRVTASGGGQASESVTLTVLDPGVDPVAPLRFVAPAAGGLVVDGPCAEFDVEVRSESFAPEDIRLSAHPGVGAACPEEAPDCLPTLRPPGPGTRKLLTWCPPAARLRESEAQSLRLLAEAGGVMAIHDFLLLFDRPALACEGAPPVIGHRPPPATTGDMVFIEAEITDDVGLRDAPNIGYFTDPPPRGEPSAEDGVRRFRLVPLEPVGDDRWRVGVPVEPPPDGSATLYYVIQARDDDGGADEACDHETTAGVFTVRIDSAGSMCMDDRFETEGEEAPTPVEPGRFDGLTICRDDIDLFAVDVPPGARFDATLEFDAARGDLDLAAALPGEDEFSLLSLSPDAPREAVESPCLATGGTALIAVVPYDDAENTYSLDIRVQADPCRAAP